MISKSHSHFRSISITTYTTFIFWVRRPERKPIMSTVGQRIVLTILILAGFGARVSAATVIADNYNVTNTGSGFALNNGANSGINPPTTRLTGSAAANLRYINTGTKATSAYTIVGNKLQVASAVNPGRFVLSADGSTPFNFASALGATTATLASPAVYDVSISMQNDSAGTQRFSFAIGTAEGDANTWSFGFQVYRAASGNNFYTIGKRIDTSASGLASDLNTAIYTMTPYTYGTEIDILMRVTDAGSETGGFHSRIQLSLNGGNSWFYDTATDSSLAGTGWRFNGAGRYFMWDAAPDAGPVTYDKFSVKTNPSTNNVNTTGTFRAMSYNIHSASGPDGHVDTQRIADFILAQDVDLVSLNEVARFMPRSDGRDTIGELAEQTGMTMVFSNNMAGLTGNDQFGNAILSRYPVIFRDHRLLPKVGDNEQRGWLKAVVDINGKFVSFWSTHLDFKADNTERLMCVTNFNTWLADETIPVVFGGDFNDTPDGPMYDRMEQKWTDIWPVAGDGSLGRTVPCPGPPFTARIDYLWKPKVSNITPVNAFVGYTIEGSDHYPILTDFTFTAFTNHAAGFFFPFNQGSGTQVTDSVAGLKGILNSSGPSWNTNSVTGQANDFSLYFDGTKKLTVVDTNQVIGTNGLNSDYTLQAWVKLPLNYAPPERAILFQYERRPGFSISINTNRTLHTTAFKQKDIASSAAIPNDGLWHHVAVVHTDGANMKFYVDGLLRATVAYTNGVGFRTSSTITLGAASEGGNWFTGYLDRVRFEQQALTSAQFDISAFEIWKATYGIVDASADPDGDGQSSLAEYTAGTNPTNAVSVFKVLSSVRQPDGKFNLTWSSVGGKRYRVQYLDGASGGIAGPFTDIVRDVNTETDPAGAGQSSTQNFTDDSASTNTTRFYRIKIVP